tara:strand:+ start:3381 stop:3557 length:177 start_codon:yes stop_codon:yes gene_type:complete
MKINYKMLLNITGILILINILIDFSTDIWGISNYPDYINSILVIFLIIFVSQIYSKNK